MFVVKINIKNFRTPIVTQKKLFFSTSNVTSLSKLKISEDVRQAISENVPVVALESTIITHGLPYPENIQMAKEVEKLIRKNGAIPASIGFVEGIPTVGLNEEEIELLGDPKLSNVKISRRDIPNVMARKLTGGTTIAATMILANSAGIDVFSTGGLGGVSRPWSLFDVSADLDELGKTPVAVVCSGPKSILDIQRTMEYLETKGVPVSTYVDEDMISKLELTIKEKLTKSNPNMNAEDYNLLNKIWENQKYNVPGFYVRNSGVKSPFVWENPSMAANMIFNGKYSMGLDNGYVFCAPAPISVAMDNTGIDKTIDDAIKLAEKENISGKELTPFLLQTLYNKTNGESAKCNIEFVKNNTILGSLVAVELAKLKGGKMSQFQPSVIEKDEIVNGQIKETKMDICNAIVIGSAAVDTMCRISSREVKLNDSNPGKIGDKTIGGVGFNVALAATFFNIKHPVMLITALNKADSAGQSVIDKITKSSIPSTGLINIDDESTAQYVSIHNSNGDLTVACAAMNIIEKLPIEKVIQLMEKQYFSKYILFDTNISVELMNNILLKANDLNKYVIIEPTSGVKCKKLGKCNIPIFPNTPIKLITPTINELAGIHSSFVNNGKFEDIDNWFNILDSIGASEIREQLIYLSNKHPIIKEYIQKGVFQQAFQLLPYFPNILIKDGANGVLLIEICKNGEKAREYISKIHNKISANDFSLVSKGGRHNLAITIQHYKALEIDNNKIVNVTGAGDCLVGGLLAQMSNNEKMSKALDTFEDDTLREELIMTAQKVAISSLIYDGSVNEDAIKNIWETS